MVTATTTFAGEYEQSKDISARRMAVASGATAATVFILCWLGTFIPFTSPTHAYIGLFTIAGPTSVQALAEGTLWSLLFGALVGGVFALIYNATAALARP